MKLSMFRTIRARYLLALLLVALLSLSAYVLLSRVIGAQADNAAVINVSGRQRMLSQRTSLFVQQLAFAQDAEERERIRTELEDATDLMERSHIGLIEGDDALNLPGDPSAAVSALYFAAPMELDAQVREHVARVRRLLALPEGALTPQNPDLQRILEDAPNRLLESLNTAVGRYELEANRQTAQLKRLEAGVLSVTLLTLLLEAVFIFGPMEREMRRRSERLVYNALHDTLTDLPNRALFTDRLEQAVLRRRRFPEHNFAVLFLDLNRFKIINDSLGHTVGDALLVAFGDRLKRCVREVDTVARLGGDEFTVLLEDVTTLETAKVLADRINRALEQPFELEGHTLHVSTSIGIVLSETGHSRPEDVLRDADIAMYRSKGSGSVGYEVFTQAMRERAFGVMSLQTDLRLAAERGELFLQYQPIVSLINGRTTGFEALVRWQHPQHGLVSPAEFIPLAEETGAIGEIDRWVLQEGVRQLGRWSRPGSGDRLTDASTGPSLSLNVSAQGFSEPDLPTFVERLLDETGVDPGKLYLEITEGTLVMSSDEVLETLNRLKVLGLKLSIDDFGTGYSSLSYLQRFPADVLKIDRSFIDKLTQSDASAKLVEKIVELAHVLGMMVVAEGVETSEQLSHLRGLSCEYFQGYYASKPLDAAAAERFLEQPEAIAQTHF